MLWVNAFSAVRRLKPRVHANRVIFDLKSRATSNVIGEESGIEEIANGMT